MCTCKCKTHTLETGAGLSEFHACRVRKPSLAMYLNREFEPRDSSRTPSPGDGAQVRSCSHCTALLKTSCLRPARADLDSQRHPRMTSFEGSCLLLPPSVLPTVWLMAVHAVSEGRAVSGRNGGPSTHCRRPGCQGKTLGPAFHAADPASRYILNMQGPAGVACCRSALPIMLCQPCHAIACAHCPVADRLPTHLVQHFVQ